MRFDDLPIFRLQQMHATSMQYTGTPDTKRCRMASGFQSVAGRFDTVHSDRVIVDKRIKQTDGVRSTTDASDHGVRQSAFEFHDLPAHFTPDHRLKIAHDARIGMRAGDSAENIKRAVDVGDPIAERLVDGVLQRLRAGVDRHDLGAEQLHAIDVDRLARDIFRSHIYNALHAEARRDGRGGDAVLAGTGLGDDAALAHVAREQGLADGVVDFVRAGVVQVFALQINARAAP